MALGDLTDPTAVRNAIDEFDQLGREAFLAKYGFRPAVSYFLRANGRTYDSKAIAGAAHGYQFPTLGPLPASEFSGGDAAAGRVLRGLGFDVDNIDSSGSGEGMPPSASRNPPWVRDELILALDLYLRRGQPDASDPLVIELSEVLNALPIHTVRPDLERFRNPNGVALKLANFAALDPAYPGVGMSRGSRLDAEVWDEFHDRPEELAAIANQLREGAAHPGRFPALPQEGEDESPEGRLLYRLHRSRERSRTLANKKKAAARAKGALVCEVCGFDFQVTYGRLGQDFIECHHVRPLSDSGSTSTRLSDLALLCSNWHSMAHRGKPRPSLDDLSHIVRGRSS
jgi:5-methylcytosine-specific restriction protein A